MFGKMFLPRYGASFLLLMLFLFAECHGVVESAGGDIKLAATREEMVRELQVMVPVMMMKISKVLRAARLGTNFLSCFVGDGANVMYLHFSGRYDISILYRRVESLRFQIQELKKHRGTWSNSNL